MTTVRLSAALNEYGWYPESNAMATRSETIGIMHQHNMRLQDFKDLISILGKRDSYSVQELKGFLGY